MPIHLMLALLLTVILAAAASVMLFGLMGLPGAAFLPATLLAALLVRRWR